MNQARYDHDESHEQLKLGDDVIKRSHNCNYAFMRLLQRPVLKYAGFVLHNGGNILCWFEEPQWGVQWSKLFASAFVVKF